MAEEEVMVQAVESTRMQLKKDIQAVRDEMVYKVDDLDHKVENLTRLVVSMTTTTTTKTTTTTTPTGA